MRVCPPAHKLAVLLLLAGCYGAHSSNADLYAAFQSARSHTELTVTGRVTRVLGVRQGPSGLHEGFILLVPNRCSPGNQGQCPAQMSVRVEDNVTITGFVPLHPGQIATVHGQYEYDSRGGVIHWTHHDPAGRHESGYIEIDAKRYQ
jgi:hypothetical protein